MTERFPSLSLLWQPQEDDDDSSTYRFEFLTEKQLEDADEAACWFPVPEILQMKDAGPSMTKWLNSRLPQEQVDQAHEPLWRLFQVIRERTSVAYYEIDSQDLHTVLQIFIRMNSGGTVLSYSEWLSEQYTNTTDRQEYQRNHLLGHIPDSIVEFDAFHDARRARLKESIGKLLE